MLISSQSPFSGPQGTFRQHLEAEGQGLPHPPPPPSTRGMREDGEGTEQDGRISVFS